MEDYNTNNQNNCRHDRLWKYLGIAFMTFIGAFLAFYCVASCTVNHFFSANYMIHRMNKFDRIANKEFGKMDNKFDRKFSRQFSHFERKPGIDFVKMPDSYKFFIDLTPFHGNTDNVKIETDGQTITISGEATLNKPDSETFTKISQTYSLCNKANLEKLSRKKVGNQYIITVPIED